VANVNNLYYDFVEHISLWRTRSIWLHCWYCVL